jgi:predicted ATPase
MLKRFYVHNFRCLENFQLQLDEPSALLIGPNGAGKSTVTHALEILQKVARGTNRVAHLVKLSDFPGSVSGAPMRFEIEAEIEGRTFKYALALELPEGFRELRVMDETLSCDGELRFGRQISEVDFSAYGKTGKFNVDWHVVALSIVQAVSPADPIAVFCSWLARMMILAPEPSRIGGTSSGPTLEPARGLANLADWFTGLVATQPAAYGLLARYLGEFYPDFKAIQNPLIGGEAREMRVQFQLDGRSLTLPFAALADGEKCFFVAAMALAAAEVYGPLVCIWDEADAHLGLSEVARFTLELRRATGPRLQFIMSSHNPEAIRMFTAQSTWLLHRASHMEPTRVSRVAELPGGTGDLLADLRRGDLFP